MCLCQRSLSLSNVVCIFWDLSPLRQTTPPREFCSTSEGPCVLLLILLNIFLALSPQIWIVSGVGPVMHSIPCARFSRDSYLLFLCLNGVYCFRRACTFGPLSEFPDVSVCSQHSSCSTTTTCFHQTSSTHGVFSIDVSATHLIPLQGISHTLEVMCVSGISGTFCATSSVFLSYYTCCICIVYVHSSGSYPFLSNWR